FLFFLEVQHPRAAKSCQRRVRGKVSFCRLPFSDYVLRLTLSLNRGLLAWLGQMLFFFTERIQMMIRPISLALTMAIILMLTTLAPAQVPSIAPPKTVPPA